MSIEKTGMAMSGLLSDFTVECNGCDETRYFTSIEFFQRMIDELKSEGWVLRKVDGEWEHYCPECSKKERG